jgi:hypothetical protein
MYSFEVRTSSWYTTHSGLRLKSDEEGWMYTTWRGEWKGQGVSGSVRRIGWRVRIFLPKPAPTLPLPTPPSGRLPMPHAHSHARRQRLDSPALRHRLV